jgi:hypothetical protein
MATIPLRTSRRRWMRIISSWKPTSISLGNGVPARQRLRAAGCLVGSCFIGRCSRTWVFRFSENGRGIRTGNGLDAKKRKRRRFAPAHAPRPNRQAAAIPYGAFPLPKTSREIDAFIAFIVLHHMRVGKP